MVLDIFDCEQSYDDGYESFCNQNCIRQLLDYYGVKNAPFFINSALGLTLVRNEQSRFGYNLLFDKRLVLHDYEDKIKIHTSYNRSTIEVWEENKAKIDEGIPVIAGVDVFHLNYAPYFRIFHGEHRVILCGYSDAEQFATIIDCYQWVFKGNIGRDSFLEARSSLCPKDDGPYSGSPINNVWLEVDKKGWNALPEELLYETVFRSLGQYYAIDSFSKEHQYMGIDALKKMLEIIIQYEETGEVGDVEFLSELRLAFLFIYMRVKLFKYYIEISSLNISLDILPSIKEQLIEELSVWDMLMRIVIKAIYKKENSYIKVISSLNKIIDMTEKRYDMLDKLHRALSQA